MVLRTYFFRRFYFVRAPEAKNAVSGDFENPLSFLEDFMLLTTTAKEWSNRL